jgi:hypothetical protein
MICCILFPPVAYFTSVLILEHYFEKKYTFEIETVLTGDTRLLLNGSVKLADAIYENVNNYLKQLRITSWGVGVRVAVKTVEGKHLFPAGWDSVADESFMPSDPFQVAAENYSLLSSGLVILVDAAIKPQGYLSLLIAGCFLILSLLFLTIHYKLAQQQFTRDVRANEIELEKLTELKNELNKRLNHLKSMKKSLEQEIQHLKSTIDEEKALAVKNEDEMIEEILLLEKQMEENKESQLAQQEEIELLRHKIETFGKIKRRDTKQRAKNLETIEKRFSTLYKNILIKRRALSGFINLPEDAKIKAEEMIHQLNQDPKVVPTKRKVFGPKGQATILEITFAYKGRLYYRIAKKNRIEILAVGTKNTQNKDLEFLNKL